VRWRSDPVEAGVDPNHDGNAFSFYFYSRLDFGLAGGGDYSYISIDTTHDAVHGKSDRHADQQPGCLLTPVDAEVDRASLPRASDHARSRLRRPPTARFRALDHADRLRMCPRRGHATIDLPARWPPLASSW
jgi:hypothetical protein